MNRAKIDTAPFLITLEAGCFDNPPDTQCVIEILREGVYALSSRATEGEFSLFLGDSRREIPLGEYPQKLNGKSPSTSDFVLPESITNSLMKLDSHSLDFMYVDEALWINVICLATGDDQWDYNFFKASELFHQSCEAIIDGGFGNFYIFGPLNDKVIFNAYENCEIVDGWGVNSIDGDSAGLVIDSNGCVQTNNVVRMTGVDYMLDRYWKIESD